jgi:hypothetical protein
MQCIARWYEDPNTGTPFRDQTLLQFGESWELLANFVLFNPGSARPLDGSDQTDRLRALGLPYLVPPRRGSRYLAFRLDPLMRQLLKCFAGHYAGGAIRIFNLLNVRSSKPGNALNYLTEHDACWPLVTPGDEVQYGDAPIVIGAGRRGHELSALQNEMAKYTARVPRDRLYALRRSGPRDFTVVRVDQAPGEWVSSYHPSYTFHYGNRTSLGELR